MKIIVVHDRYSNEPIVVCPDKISMIRKAQEGDEEHSSIIVEGFMTNLKETIGDVMAKIKKADGEEE